MKKLIMMLLWGVIIMSLSAENNNAVLAMIFQEKNIPFNTKQLESDISKELSISLSEPLVDKDGVIVFINNSVTYAIARMPVGIPKEDFESAADYSLLYKDKIGLYDKQKAHILLSVISKDNDVIMQQLLLTKLTRAVLKNTNSLGVYWGSSVQLIQPDVFFAFSNQMSSEALPIPLWVNFCVYKNAKGKINMHTIGMKSLGYPEYEIINLKMNWNDGYYFLVEFTNYMIVSNDIIKDGDTIGRDEKEKLKVTYPKSEITDDKKVMRIEM